MKWSNSCERNGDSATIGEFYFPACSNIAHLAFLKLSYWFNISDFQIKFVLVDVNLGADQGIYNSNDSSLME